MRSICKSLYGSHSLINAGWDPASGLGSFNYVALRDAALAAAVASQTNSGEEAKELDPVLLIVGVVGGVALVIFFGLMFVVMNRVRDGSRR